MQEEEAISGEGDIDPCSRRSFYGPTKVDEAIGFRITLYLKVEENWSPAYDKEEIYKDKNGDTASIPQGFRVSKQNGQNTIAEGLVVKDSKENEWVWIEVPKTEKVYPTAGLKVKDFTNEEYTKIEADLQNYTSAYRQTGYTDTWYSEAQHGFKSAEEYNNHKKSMLKSVYENGGFYIGRYEAGTETARYNSSNTLTDVVIKKDSYPYNFITCAQAQTKAKELATGGKTSSLMFGLQWDLVLKHIEEKGTTLGKTREERQAKLKTDSSDWGNYKNADFIVTRGKYSILNTDTWELGEWNTINNTTKKTANSSILLTTGATDRNSVLGIYDLAGNIWSWTLSKSSNDAVPCATIGGGCYNSDPNCQVTYHSCDVVSHSVSYLGFRVALW